MLKELEGRNSLVVEQGKQIQYLNTALNQQMTGDPEVERDTLKVQVSRLNKDTTELGAKVAKLSEDNKKLRSSNRDLERQVKASERLARIKREQESRAERQLQELKDEVQSLREEGRCRERKIEEAGGS